jgi:acetyl esterase/lipase
MKTAVPLILLLFCVTMLGQQKTIRLYEGPAPGSENWKQQEKENRNNLWQTRVVYNVKDPTIIASMPEPSKANGTAVIICPGGGFQALSIDSEGLDVARWLSARGIACFVLKYRLIESLTDDPVKEVMDKMGDPKKLDEAVAPILRLAVEDGKAAIGYVRQHAREYGIKPNHIGIMGFSAGGTLTASVAYTYTPETRPDFAAPIYLQYDWTIKPAVPADAPPMFILAATDDQLGLAPHSIALYQAWTSSKKSAELHLFSKGGHGFGMRKQDLPSDRWIERFMDWLQVQGLTKQ